MKIRSITCFCNPYHYKVPKVPSKIQAFMQEAKIDFLQAGFEVQTTRIATVPFGDYFPSFPNDGWVSIAQNLEQQTLASGCDYLSMGPAATNRIQSYDVITKILENTEAVFIAANITNKKSEISFRIAHKVAEAIHENAFISKDGFVNLRFAALANVPPFTPFFPAAFSQGNALSFALAMECADAAVNAFQQAENVNEGIRLLLEGLESNARKMQLIASGLGKKYAITFKGFDFSLAPFPDDECSIAKALEMLAPSRIGGLTSLTACSILADALDRGKWKKAGFNGLMLPILEDSILALRTQQNTLDVQDLLLYSAVCGTGLDTIPLPGDTSVGTLQALLLDVSALALRMDKPLTARLMPIPGKKVGDMTQFKFDYFANGKVLNCKTSSVTGLIKKSRSVKINPR